MARRRVEIVSSDLTGREIDDPSQVAEVRVLSHPFISSPVTLDAYVLEVAGLESTKRELATIELILPNTPPKQLTIDVEDFNKLFTSDVDEVLNSAAPYHRGDTAQSTLRGRRAAGRGKAALEKPALSVSRDQRTAIRAWANSNGYTVGDRGRIKAEVIDAFQLAHSTS